MLKWAGPSNFIAVYYIWEKTELKKCIKFDVYGWKLWVFGFVNQFSQKVVYVRSIPVADCDTYHCVVTAKGGERLSMSKQTQIFYAAM